VAIASVSEPESILQAMRAGANEFFVWPEGSSVAPESIQEGIREAIKKTSLRLNSAGQDGAESSHVLSFFGTKGGVGTTTIAVNCATELARLSKRPTLIVDLNPFIGEVGLFLGVRPRFTVVDALDSVDRLDTVFLKRLVATHKSGLDIMAGSELVDRPNARDGERMQELFGVLKESYPYIVLDAGGLTNSSAASALFGSDASFLVTNPDVASIRNTRRMIDRMRKMGAGPDRVRLLLNRTSDNPAFAPDQIEEVVGRPVDHSFPSDYRTVSEALNSGVPLTTTNNTELAAEFGRFMRKLAGLKTAGVKEDRRQPGQFLGLF
jgi:pilus assembly protein CpaE